MNREGKDAKGELEVANRRQKQIFLLDLMDCIF
jgi:hypothetical protein